MDTESFPRAEEALRLLAAAVGAARLYPPASALPRQAVARFVDRSIETTAGGPLRFVVEPSGFRFGGTELAAGQNQPGALAESLHAMQVGQLVIAPGIGEDETRLFVSIVNMDPASVRSQGGIRAMLGHAGVTHIAVIEVTLRASDEEGLLGIDLTTAPLDEIAVQMAAAAERRALEAVVGPAADEMATAIEHLEDATRELAVERVAAAMMRLDEQTRERVLACSLAADTHGQRMDGMLQVVARMKPAALARLLRLVAVQTDTDPRRIASTLSLPPETLSLLAMLLEPRPRLDPDFGLTSEAQAAQIAQAIAAPEDTSDLERQIVASRPVVSAQRALSTAVAVSRAHSDDETVKAIADVLPQAARDGALSTVREALRRLDELAVDPAMANSVIAARATLTDSGVLSDVCRAARSDADAAIAGEIVRAAGSAGAEALLDTYIHMPEPRRSLLRPVMRSMSESVLGVARQRLRTAEPPIAIAIVRTLPHLGDRRVVPIITGALNNFDEQVRFAAATALADLRVPEAGSALLHAINHREPETQRFVVREIARAHIEGAVPALSRALEDINIFQRTYETRKEIIAAFEQIGTPEAEKALRRFAQRTVSLGKKTKELRLRASRAAAELAEKRGVRQP